MTYFLDRVLPHLELIAFTAWFCYAVCVWASEPPEEPWE